MAATTALSAVDEDIDVIVSTDTPVVLSRKDALYQGSLHNIPLYNKNIDDYHDQMITTTDDALAKPHKKKSFFAKVTEEIDLNLLRDAAFVLFAVSNFLTSLGFNVPYIFAKDLANDAKVPEKYQSWPIMAIGIANCFGRVVFGILGDRKWVSRSSAHLHELDSTIIRRSIG